MANLNTKIEWADATWSPVTGCSKVSPGCKNCYAEGVANRFWAKQYPRVSVDGTSTRPREFTDVQIHPDRLTGPLKWKGPRRIFVNSMSDLFHEDIPDEFIDQVFAVMAMAHWHTFQVLSKRPERARKYLSASQWDFQDRLASASRKITGNHLAPLSEPTWRWPLPNVWLGVSVENRETLKRIDVLRETPCALRFLSLEPLLEDLWEINLEGIGWVIIGGESGHGARPFEIGWARSIIAQCREAGIPAFMKQVGSKPGYRNREPFCGWNDLHNNGEKLKDKKGGDPAEWPADLRVREFPVWT